MAERGEAAAVREALLRRLNLFHVRWQIASDLPFRTGPIKVWRGRPLAGYSDDDLAVVVAEMATLAQRARPIGEGV